MFGETSGYCTYIGTGWCSRLKYQYQKLKHTDWTALFRDDSVHWSDWSSDCASAVLQCTCLAVSRKWLALGTSAGGLHLIQREGWKQRLILTHKVSLCVCFNGTIAVIRPLIKQVFCWGVSTGGLDLPGLMLPARWRLYRCCNKVSKIHLLRLQL